MKLLVVLFVLITTTVFSQIDYLPERWSFDFNLASYHYKRDGYNEKNLGIGVEYKWRYGKPDNLFNRSRLTLGFFENSYNKTTVYSGILFPIREKRKLGYGLSIGAGSGYQDELNFVGNPVYVMVFGFGYLEYDFGWIRPRLLISPLLAAFQVNIGK